MVRPSRPRDATKTHGEILYPEPQRLCAAVTDYTARLVPPSLLKDSSESIGLHLEAPRGGGWAEKKQSSTQLRFKKRRSCAEGGGEKSGRRLQPLCPGKRRAGNFPGGPPPQLSNPSPAVVLPGHVSTGSLSVRPKDFLKPPPPAARKKL